MEMATRDIPAEADAPLTASPADIVPVSALGVAGGELDAILRSWARTLTHPSAALESHRTSANWAEVILSACAVAAAGALWLYRAASTQRLPLAVGWLPLLGLAACAAYVAVVGVSYLAAKLLGGNGRFVEQAYLTSLGVTPLALLVLATQPLPLVGDAIAAVAVAYALCLALLALRAAHHLPAVAAGGPALSWRYAYFLIGIVPAAAGFCALFVIYNLIVASLPPVH